MRNLGSILIVAFIAGCGGSEKILTPSLGTTNSGGNPNSGMSTGVLILDIFSKPLSTSEATPTGTATYQGRAAFSTDTEDSLSIAQNPSFVSSVTVTANLQYGGLTAKFYNFSTGGGLPIEGDIQSSIANINGTQLGTASGNLNLPTGVVEYSGDISGQFRGQYADFFTGYLQLNSSSGELNGIYAAQR